MGFVVFSVLLAVVRRVRPVTVALALYETWKRLPPEHRDRILASARRNAPRLASSLVRRGRARV